MSDFVIYTDSGSDLQPALLRQWGVSCVHLTFRFDGEEAEHTNEDYDIRDFFARMRDGDTAKTAAVNPETFKSHFEEVLAAGRDVLYLGFSSGLSTTANAARIAAAELTEAYPDRKIITVDTLAASAGLGLLVYLAVEKKNSGADIEGVASYIEGLKNKLCHWFTVDDLVYLKRGGRVSAAAAFVGGMLGIKPLLHVDDAGKLIPISKIRGRRAALSAIVQKYGETAVDPAGGTVYISHADCTADAQFVADQLKEKYGATVSVTTYIGAVIGAHCGPGTLALFYVGNQK